MMLNGNLESRLRRSCPTELPRDAARDELRSELQRLCRTSENVESLSAASALALCMVLMVGVLAVNLIHASGRDETSAQGAGIDFATQATRLPERLVLPDGAGALFLRHDSAEIARRFEGERRYFE